MLAELPFDQELVPAGQTATFDIYARSHGRFESLRISPSCVDGFRVEDIQIGMYQVLPCPLPARCFLDDCVDLHPQRTYEANQPIRVKVTNTTSETRVFRALAVVEETKRTVHVLFPEPEHVSFPMINSPDPEANITYAANVRRDIDRRGEILTRELTDAERVVAYFDRGTSGVMRRMIRAAESAQINLEWRSLERESTTRVCSMHDEYSGEPCPYCGHVRVPVPSWARMGTLVLLDGVTWRIAGLPGSTNGGTRANAHTREFVRAERVDGSSDTIALRPEDLARATRVSEDVLEKG
jgi:hypothetical protein